jgi:hypothetical protein
MERETRFELATLSLATRCSTTELFPRSPFIYPERGVLVGKEGLEPSRLAALEPKSSASANSATRP